MPATTGPQSFSQPSRKTKRAWRKNIDLTEVSQGLESAREEKIATGGLLADQPSNALFQTDIVGDSNVRTRARKDHGPLKADEIIAQRSAVPAVTSRKRPGDSSASKLSDGILPEKRRKKNSLSHQEHQRLRQLAYGGDSSRKDLQQASDSASYDLWDVVDTPAPTQEQDFIEPPKPIRAPNTIKRAPISLRADGRQQANVSRPNAGRSYNPAFEDWSALLSKEGEKAVEVEKRRLLAAEQEAARLERVAKAAEEAEKENEQTDRSDYESEWEGIQSDLDESQLRRKRPQRKTPAERNKVKRRQEAERLARHQSRMKQRDEQAKRIKTIKAEIEKNQAMRENALVLAQSLSDSDNADQEQIHLRRRRLGKHAVPEQPLELVLPDELQDSLRKLKPEGNLLNDRFRNMMVQGKIEARRPTQPKKAKTKLTEKWSYKDWELA